MSPETWEISPALSRVVAQSGVADAAGNINIDPNVDGTGTSIDQRLADFILYGVINGSFSRGPTADPTGFIDPVNNPMPDWNGPTQVSGGAIQASWVADATGPSGNALRFTLNPGAASDEATFTQILPIGGAAFRSFANYGRISVRRTALSGTSVQAYIDLQYLDANGAAVGNETRSLSSLGLATVTIRDVMAHSDTLSPPSNAASLQIKLGVLRTGAANGTATVDIFDVRVDRAPVRLLVAEYSDPTTSAAAWIEQQLGSLMFIPSGGNRANAVLTLGAPAPGSEQLVWTGVGGMYLTAGPTIYGSIIRATISADQNDYAPTGLSTCGTLVVTASGAIRTITGFSASGFTEGQTFNVVNTATNSIVFAHSSASSTSGNRIGCVNAANLTIRANGSAIFQYLPTDFPVPPFRMLSVNA